MGEPRQPNQPAAAATPARPAAMTTFGGDAPAPPWADLARLPGWVLWLAEDSPPVALAAQALPLPKTIGADRRAALAYAADLVHAYAERRRLHGELPRAVLAREGPLAVVAPEPIPASLTEPITDIGALGIPVLAPGPDLPTRLALQPPFTARTWGHRTILSRPHDPALSFQALEPATLIGDNALSSFVLHHEGEHDGVRITGSIGPRWGVEIGLRGPGIDLAATARLEDAAAMIPGFLDGVLARRIGPALVVGWAEGRAPTPEELGELWRAWLPALYGATLVDVRIAFAPPHGRSALLTDMRARAAAFAALRAEAIPPGNVTGPAAVG